MTASASHSKAETLRHPRELARDLWVLEFPLALLGAQLGRRTTVIRLCSGELVIHSTGPFTSVDVAAIRGLGQPAWLVDATLFHDTFARAGAGAFPNVPYLAPPGIRAAGVNTAPLLENVPRAWAGELDVLEIEGMPKVREHVFFHVPSRTLIVADFVFNFGPQSTPWTRWFFRVPGGVGEFPGMSRLFRASIRDRGAFSASIQRMLAWDFDRCVVAHGDIIESNAKAVLTRAVGRHGF